ncbi:MAG: hypothetical protein RMA76_45900 [Deltaproteobacteria bacterium]|jgi:hypothetical protein
MTEPFDFASLESACRFFGAFLSERCPGDAQSITDVLSSMQQHTLSRDPALQDRFARVDEPLRKSERDRRLVWVENQRSFYAFVSAANREDLTSPVFFASSLDLVDDYGIERSAVQDDGSCLIASSFAHFFWFALGFAIALRAERPDCFGASVSPRSICIPAWGAAFADADRRDAFLGRYAPRVESTW